MTRACRCREAKFPAGVMCCGSRGSWAPRGRRRRAGAGGRRGRLGGGCGTCGGSPPASSPAGGRWVRRSVCLSVFLGNPFGAGREMPSPGGPKRTPPPATCPLSWRTWRLASGYFSRWGGGRGEDTTYPPNYAQARLCFPLQINFKEQTAGPGGKEAGEERGNGLGTAAAKRVKFRAQSRLVHAPAAQHLPGVWRTRCSTSLPCYPKLIDDGFPARLYLTERCGELL